MFGRLDRPSSELLRDLVGMTVAGLTAGILCFLWRNQQHEKMRLLREREHAVRHVHHHVRNSLQVIVNRHHDDPVVVQYVDQIIREMEHALPSRHRPPSPRHPDDVESPQ